ncbi:hypothetical protein ACFVOB_22115 [Streptomyces rochei]|uniref:hypothetical protein n=1 Tax=Streptomyces rochei TaxID=1928 RepID=UPI00369FAE16
MTDTRWNGESCLARRITAIVSDDGRFPAYWARDLVGTRRNAVEITYGGSTFYLDDEDGSGWAKVTSGGSPARAQRSLTVVPGSIEPRPSAEIETTARVFAALHRSAEDTVTRVIDLYEQWVKAGPPPLGVSVSRWWDARLVELHDAIQPPQPAPARCCGKPPGVICVHDVTPPADQTTEK